MPLKQAGDISIIASQCHSLEPPQSTSKHWLKRGKIMTVNNKKERWSCRSQDPSLFLCHLSRSLFSCFCSRWIIVSPYKLPPCPFDTSMINCSNIKVYIDLCMIVTFQKCFWLEMFVMWGEAWQCAECRCFHHCLFTRNMQNLSCNAILA